MIVESLLHDNEIASKFLKCCFPISACELQKMSVCLNPKPGLNYGSWKLGEFSDRQQAEKSLTRRGFGTHGLVTGNKTGTDLVQIRYRS